MNTSGETSARGMGNIRAVCVIRAGETGKEDRKMYTEMYIRGEEKSKRKKILKAGGIILWVLMIGVTMFLTFQSVAIAG